MPPPSIRLREGGSAAGVRRSSHRRGRSPRPGSETPEFLDFSRILTFSTHQLSKQKLSNLFRHPGAFHGGARARRPGASAEAPPRVGDSSKINPKTKRPPGNRRSRFCKPRARPLRRSTGRGRVRPLPSTPPRGGRQQEHFSDRAPGPRRNMGASHSSRAESPQWPSGTGGSFSNRVGFSRWPSA